MGIEGSVCQRLSWTAQANHIEQYMPYGDKEKTFGLKQIRPGKAAKQNFISLLFY